MITDNAKHIVVNENILGYTKPGMNGIGILSASILKGATCNPLGGTIAMPVDQSGIRPATLEDFVAFGVLAPPSYRVNTGGSWC